MDSVIQAPLFEKPSRRKDVQKRILNQLRSDFAYGLARSRTEARELAIELHDSVTDKIPEVVFKKSNQKGIMMDQAHSPEKRSIRWKPDSELFEFHYIPPREGKDIPSQVWTEQIV